MPESSVQQNKPKQSYEIFESATADLRRKLRTQERYKNSHHQLFSVVFNVLAIVQLAIGATITALGPLADEHMLAITILGALNTVVAGILALMKGRGLPQRLRNDIAEIRKVLTFIDNTGIRLKYSNNNYPNSEVMRLIDEALGRYITMCEIIERNQPDSYAGGNTMPQNHANNEPLEGTDKKNKILAKDRQPDEEMGHDL
ncbi:hypothetical protein BJX96DRAFT_182525 [Aspergillus floccosus]